MDVLLHVEAVCYTESHCRRGHQLHQSGCSFGRHRMRLPRGLNLDDGVKVNYAKFGDLLAEAKTITGGQDDE